MHPAGNVLIEQLINSVDEKWTEPMKMYAFFLEGIDHVINIHNDAGLFLVPSIVYMKLMAKGEKISFDEFKEMYKEEFKKSLEFIFSDGEEENEITK